MEGCISGGANLRRATREQLKRLSSLSPEKWLKPRPETGLDCLICAESTRQQISKPIPKALIARPYTIRSNPKSKAPSPSQTDVEDCMSESAKIDKVCALISVISEQASPLNSETYLVSHNVLIE